MPSGLVKEGCRFSPAAQRFARSGSFLPRAVLVTVMGDCETVQRAELEEMRAVLSELRSLLQAEGFYLEHVCLFRRCFELLAWADTESEAVPAGRVGPVVRTEPMVPTGTEWKFTSAQGRNHPVPPPLSTARCDLPIRPHACLYRCRFRSTAEESHRRPSDARLKEC